MVACPVYRPTTNACWFRCAAPKLLAFVPHSSNFSMHQTLYNINRAENCSSAHNRKRSICLRLKFHQRHTTKSRASFHHLQQNNLTECNISLFVPTRQVFLQGILNLVKVRKLFCAEPDASGIGKVQQAFHNSPLIAHQSHRNVSSLLLLIVLS